MDILNVIVTDKFDDKGNIISIDSFPVHEEQLKDDVVSFAETRFLDLCVKNGIDEVDAEESIEDGYCETKTIMVSLVWSNAQ
ncbi:MAG: hypothetical protein PF487_09010 [Bacteroidales bacterium]|jgi:hypothetical protein|nr:hypothetical protein [Bacteroidales bacterium]